MAYDAFLKIDGIKGESSDDAHKDEIEVVAYSHVMSTPASTTRSSAGGGAAARVDHGEFVITKELDLASPKLAESLCKGDHIKEIVLSLNRAGGDKVEYMQYKMTHVIITSIAASGDPGGNATVPLETINFNYGTIEWTYTQQQSADGTGGGKVAAGWDCEKNKVL